MTTTLFAIFGIALVATLAWVITRIVNIFVELEGLHQQAKDFSERMDNHCAKVNKLKADVDQLKQAQALIVEHQEQVDELLKKAAEGEVTTSKCLELMRGIIEKQDEKMSSVVEMGNALQEAQKALLKMAEELIGIYSNGDKKYVQLILEEDHEDN